MNLREILKSRRSIRAYTSDSISDIQIDAILEAAVWAPSPLNLQPWEFIVVTDDGLKSQIKNEAERAKEMVTAANGPGWAAKYNMDFLEQAPVLIVVVFDPAKGGLGGFFNSPHGAMMSVGASIQNLMLAATEMGLGTLWFTFFDPVGMGRILDVPDELSVAGVISLGRSAGETKTPPRKPPKVHDQKYQS